MRGLVHIALLLAGIGTLSGCTRSGEPLSVAPLSTRAAGAPDLMIRYGCPTCHVIPGVPGAVGKVGPPLASLSQRSALAGRLPNSHANLMQWLMHPQSVEPGVAMPDMGINQKDAETIAYYLESLK